MNEIADSNTNPAATSGAAGASNAGPLRPRLERGSLQKILLNALAQAPEGLAGKELEAIGIEHGSTAKSVSVALPRMRSNGLILRGGRGYLLTGVEPGSRKGAMRKTTKGAKAAKAPKATPVKAAAKAAPISSGPPVKPHRWAPGALQEVVRSELRKAPQTRRALYDTLSTTGRTSIVAALKAMTDVVEQDGVYSLRGSASPRPAAPVAAPAPAARKAAKPAASAPAVASPSLAKFAELPSEGESQSMGEDLRLAVAISKALEPLLGLPEAQCNRIVTLATLLSDGRIRVG